MSRSSARRPSPPSSPGQEETFRAKLREVKLMREAGVLGKTATPTLDGEGDLPPPPSPPRKKKRVIINGKPAQEIMGDWAKMASSRSVDNFTLCVNNDQMAEIGKN